MVRNTLHYTPNTQSYLTCSPSLQLITGIIRFLSSGFSLQRSLTPSPLSLEVCFQYEHFMDSAKQSPYQRDT